MFVCVGLVQYEVEAGQAQDAGMANFIQSLRNIIKVRLAAWCPVPGAWCLVASAWWQVPGARCLVAGAWRQQQAVLTL